MSMTGSATGSGRRSCLAVPATDPGRIAKAIGGGADEVIVDLEDAVAPGSKNAAREVVTTFDWTAVPDGVRIAIRINAVGTPWCHRDLEAIVRHGVPAASVVLPKVESRADIGFVERLLTGLESEAGTESAVRVQALIETAAGLVRLDEIAARPGRLDSLVIGYADLAASLGRGASPGPGSWLAAQDRIVTCARMAGIEAVDGPHLGVHDDEDFRAVAAHAAALGFDAKWVIHPRQVRAINEIFSPSARDIEYARRVIEALGSTHADGRGALELDGMLVDEAMALAARRILAKAGE